MKLRTQVIVFIAASTLLSFLLTQMMLERILLDRFTQLDESRIHNKLNDITATLQDELEIIKTNMYNYSIWNETAEFVNSVNPDENPLEHPYIISNYGLSTYQTNRWDHLLLLSAKNEMVYAQSYHEAIELLTPIPRDLEEIILSHVEQLMKFSPSVSSKAGLFVFQDQPLMIVSVPILREDTGGYYGTMIAARSVNKEQLMRIEKRSRAKIELHPLTDKSKRESVDAGMWIWFEKVNRDRVIVHTVVNDIFGKPTWEITTEQKRSILASGREAVQRYSYYLFGIHIAAALALMFGLHRFILLRMKRLVHNIREIERQKDLSRRILVKGSGEFAELESEFNHMMASLENANETLRCQMRLDSLTQVPNRSYFYEIVEDALIQARQNGDFLAILFIDLNDFKLINDTWGHDYGDGLLIELTERIRGMLRPGDAIARLGGDEFTVLLTNVQSKPEVIQWMSELHEAIGAPMRILGRTLQTSASIGFSFYPENGEDLDSLIKQADVSMFQMKKLREIDPHSFTQELAVRIHRVSLLEKELSQAVTTNQLVLHYQPLMDVSKKQIRKLEALVRWQHPELGLIPPLEFIPLAESTGLIIEIGRWVLRQVCDDLNELDKRGIHLKIALNISPAQLEHHELLQEFQEIIRKHNVSAERLILEITEGMLMSNDRASASIQKLRELGFSVALDDFGTGYSSLSYLRRFPVDAIKMDRAFVTELTDGCTPDRTLVKTMIDLGHNLGMKVVAEGVEHKEQLATLTQLGCDLVQGYYISKPLPLESLIVLLEEYE